MIPFFRKEHPFYSTGAVSAPGIAGRGKCRGLHHHNPRGGKNARFHDLALTRRIAVPTLDVHHSETNLREQHNFKESINKNLTSRFLDYRLIL